MKHSLGFLALVRDAKKRVRETNVAAMPGPAPPIQLLSTMAQTKNGV